MSDLSLEFQNPPPTVARFLASDAFVRGIRGPIGSGKSTACCYEIMRRAAMQRPGADGIARTRFAVVRNTYPELKTTTIKTWHAMVPQTVGRWVDQGPPTHHLKFEGQEIEVMFLALDSPADVAKLLSLELTAAWINEAREVPKAVLDGLTGRVGRYPSMRDGGATWAGILMDTNPPDTDHWWYALAERDTTSTFGRQMLASVEEAERELREKGLLRAGQHLFEFFAQPSGESPEAENLPNLRPGYYQLAKAGKREEWVNVYVRGQYGFVLDGRPVHPGYRDSVHCRPFGVVPGWPWFVGIDFGLTPAAVIMQRSPVGTYRVRYELTTERMGAKRFGLLLAQFLAEKGIDPEGVTRYTGDPAGASEAQTDESTPFAMLKAGGITAHPAPTNDWAVRLEALDGPLGRLVDGEPGILVHPDCQMIRKGLGGRYAYKRVQVAGDERYHDKPDKNAYSHPCEALHYALLGAGEARVALGRRKRDSQPKRGQTEYNEFG